jgi:hypothetical protein
VESEAPDDLGFRHYVIEDVSGARHQLTYGAPTDPPPLGQGQTYGLQVEYIPGMPSPNGILVHDDKGLLFAAASDHGPGSARLGSYLVACLLAQDVRYSDACADAGMFRIAYTITRVSG